jgi:RHS repeat-associated protein
MLYQSDTVLNQQVTFGYDEFNRLNARTVTQGTVQNYTYGYDLYGNRVSQTPLQGGYSFNPTINPVNNQITTSGYVYDPAGNMTNDTVHSYAYDAEGNLVLVDGGNTAQYVYDVFNHRIRVQTTSATTEYLYDYAGRRVSSWVASSNTGNEGRIYWDGQMVAYRSLEAFTYFNHEDTLGTERIRTNYAGYTASTYQSLPWGDGYSSTVNNFGGDQDNLHFAGLERDAESGTEHAQFRNYASAQGRWLAPDSYMGSYDVTNPQSMNRYAYALNNPTSFLDPSGLYTCPTCVGPPDLCDFDPLFCFGGSEGGGGYGGGGGGGRGGGSNPGNPGKPFVFSVTAYLIWLQTFQLQLATLTSIPFQPDSSAGLGAAPNNGQTWKQFGQAAKSCAKSSFGASAAAGVGALAAGSNILSTGTKIGSFTPGTSLASQFFRSVLPQRIGPTLAPTLMNPLAESSILGGVVGRWVPVVGEALLVVNGANFVSCLWDSDSNY